MNAYRNDVHCYGAYTPYSVCSSCGARIDHRARFCNRCGKITTPAAQWEPSSAPRASSRPVRSHETPRYTDSYRCNSYEQPRQALSRYSGHDSRSAYNYSRCSVDPAVALSHVTKRMKTSGTIWLLIGINQLLFGIVTMFIGYGIFPLVVGIWNLTNSSKQKRIAAEYAANPTGIIAAYENGRTTSIVFIFVNLFLGAGFGVLGSIYDLVTCNYVLSHKDAFNELERMARCA